ncbi:glycosyltransferase family 2 protein [Flavobacterium orientale]|uniref:Glycosyl transferase n=1 Tax=Flavobacterium orientale TaxID=1756020 RepID=A0A917DBH4_9FLAO|nr:glycosyltransferase family A protein [Flavobacterium orientale]GGD25839.1 glycosyl transferase [Flavobacterium orientale]
MELLYLFKYKKHLESKYTKSDIEILIATMNRDNFDFLTPMFPFANYWDFSLVIVHQTKGSPLVSQHENVKVINSQEFGLSKSRNLALANATKELLVITDDDVIYKSDFESKIIAAFNHFQNPAMVKFCSEKDENVATHKYPKIRKETLNWFDILNTISFEIVVNRKQLTSNQIKFDERFGLGSTFGAGEEQVFLTAINKAGLKMSFEPQVLVVHPQPTTNYKISIEQKYYIQGAVLTALFPNFYRFWLLLKVFFDWKQGKLSTKEFKLAFQNFKSGRTDFLKK